MHEHAIRARIGENAKALFTPLQSRCHLTTGAPRECADHGRDDDCRTGAEEEQEGRAVLCLGLFKQRLLLGFDHLGQLLDERFPHSETLRVTEDPPRTVRVDAHRRRGIHVTQADRAESTEQLNRPCALLRVGGRERLNHSQCRVTAAMDDCDRLPVDWILRLHEVACVDLRVEPKALDGFQRANDLMRSLHADKRLSQRDGAPRQQQQCSEAYRSGDRFSPAQAVLDSSPFRRWHPARSAPRSRSRDP